MAGSKGGAPLGNQNNVRHKRFLETLTKIIVQEELTVVEKKRRLNMAAHKLLTLAAQGVEWAVKELANRVDGKAVQGVELTGAEGKPMNFFDPANLRNLSPEETDVLKALLKKAADE